MQKGPDHCGKKLRFVPAKLFRESIPHPGRMDMAKNRLAKKEINSRKRKVRRRDIRRTGERLEFERLENRKMMSVIDWTNRAEFDFGANTAAARLVIDRAITDWSLVIEDFNYVEGGRYRFEIDVEDLPADTLASNSIE